jgi:antitoxin component of MazEF toxin-antitoxin module
MAVVRTLQKIGNSRGVVLTKDMLAHLGVEDRVEIAFEKGQIILTAPSSSSRLTPGRNRQSFEAAKDATFAQYGPALQRLADVAEGSREPEES